MIFGERHEHVDKAAPVGGPIRRLLDGEMGRAEFSDPAGDPHRRAGGGRRGRTSPDGRVAYARQYGAGGDPAPLHMLRRSTT